MNVESLAKGQELAQKIEKVRYRLGDLQRLKNLDQPSARVFVVVQGLDHHGHAGNLQYEGRFETANALLGNALKVFLSIAEDELKSYLRSLEAEFEGL